MQTACLIIIGDEILSGRTQDKNLAFIAKGLNEKGIPLKEVRVVADDEAAIIEAVNACRKEYSYVFTTGGIGPTHDDITAESISKAFGVPYELQPEAERILRDHYKDQINDDRLRMARMPRGARLISGSAASPSPGFTIDNVYVMAGVPVIMQAMFNNIIPTLEGGKKMLSKAVSAFTVEGNFAGKLRKIAQTHADVTIGSYPFKRDERLGVTLIVRSTESEKLDAAYKDVKNMLEKLGVEAIEGDMASQTASTDWSAERNPPQGRFSA